MQYRKKKAMGQSLLLVLITSLACGHAIVEEEWQGWKDKHYKFYSTPDEEGSRLSVWRENYQKIKEHNMANHSFTLSLNQFADMVGYRFRSIRAFGITLWKTYFFQTQEEFSLLYLAQARDAREFPRSGNIHKPQLTSALGTEGVPLKDYPSSLDYRQKGHVTSVSQDCLLRNTNNS